MKNDSGRALYWRRFMVDVLTGLTALALALAAAGATELLYVFLIPGALLAASLLLEPDVERHPTARSSRPSRSTEPKPA